MSQGFRLQQFSISQERSAMKVGTDAILLGSWLGELGLSPQAFLDVGTGTGIIALMLAQHFPETIGTALEIDEGSAWDARDNVARSPFASRLEVIAGDFFTHPLCSYDLIVSNPPYFESSGILSPEQRRQRARHEMSLGLNLCTLMQRASALLSPHGTLALVTPSDREDDLRLYAAQCLLRPRVLTRVFSSPERLVRSLSLWERVQTDTTSYLSTASNSITLRDGQGSYTDEYKRLTSKFLTSY